MSLDVYLTLEGVLGVGESKPRIFIREDGQTKEISREEWDERYPGVEPATVESPLDASEVYSANITHNLGRMAGAAGIYEALWRPEEIGITKAEQLIEPLAKGLALLREFPSRFRALNPPNGWGNYEGLARFVEDYLAACREYPEAKVNVWR